MTDKKDDDKVKASGKKKKTLSLSSKGTLGLKGGAGPARQSSVSAGRSGQTVAVEVRKTRARGGTDTKAAAGDNDQGLTAEEHEARAEAVKKAAAAPKKEASLPPPVKPTRKQRPSFDDDTPAQQSDDAQQRQKIAERAGEVAAQKVETHRRKDPTKDDLADKKTKTPVKRTGEPKRRSGKLTVTQVLNEEYESDSRQRSLAAQRRAREREKMRLSEGQTIEHKKQVRDIKVPEVIVVKELANRMAESTGEVVKKLMELGVMATATQTIDADTAELLISEFGHTITRVSDSDVEIGLGGEQEDTAENLQPRPPVVTIMGHVDHGKTSLLDAIRETDVVAGESGGITQHIGAYQVTLKDNKKITFLDTPGHAAFTEMRARGADITDIVVLVVAANDSIMPQTVEAISHAKAAGKPIIVAINKCDLAEADPVKVRNELLQYEVIPEEMGGDVITIEVSALTKQGLDKLEESILLQAEIMELKANPDRVGHGTVVESKLEQGRGSVATVLIQRGTLRVGDIFVTGSEFGKVRALLNDHGKQVDQAIPGQPVEVLGLSGTPEAGDDFVVVENEAKARQIASYRARKKRQMEQAKLAKATGSLDQLLDNLKKGEAEALPVIIKADVHGSVEAIIGSLQKLTQDNEEVKVNILHSGVGGITESDVTLAKSTNAFLVGFNVRANAQARDLAARDNVDIRYYSIIYEVIDDAKNMLSGMLAPELHENLLGYAEIRQVFNITKVGKVAGCMVSDGVVKRGAKVRLLRDDVVIHEGALKTLQRFKDEVKEVAQGYECGMAFENYDDIKEGDMIECFDVIEKARELDTASNG